VKVSVFGTVIVAAGVLAIGCGCASSGHNAAADSATSTPASSASTPSSTSSPAGTGQPVSAGATTPASTTAGGNGGNSGAPAACATSALKVAQAPGSGGAAGSFFFDLTFTNTGSSSCTLFGYPGVSFTTSGHSQLGQPAQRDPSTAKLITLTPGGVASNQVRVPDVDVFSKSSCKPATAAYIKVYPPNQTAWVYVPTSTKVCTTSQGRTGIQTVVSGSHAGV
jgi:Protein of unknown function (DUF4232)